MQILLVDDHEMVRLGRKLFGFTDDVDVVAEAQTVVKGVEKL